MPRLFLCKQCGAMVFAQSACSCGSMTFVHPSLAPWKLSPFDQHFLPSLRIATEDRDEPDSLVRRV